MTGIHSRARFFRSPTGIVSLAAVGVALAVGGTVGAVQLTGEPAGVSAPIMTPSAEGPEPAATSASPSASSPSASTGPTLSAKPSPSRLPQRASRAKTRPAVPKLTVSRKSPAATVVESGTCGASFYDEGQLTATGEVFNPDALTAAHKTLPFDTKVRVTNPANGKSVTVRINDRGPYIDGRCLDLSRAAFAEIASLDVGALTVKYEILK